MNQPKKSSGKYEFFFWKSFIKLGVFFLNYEKTK